MNCVIIILFYLFIDEQTLGKLIGKL